MESPANGSQEYQSTEFVEEVISLISHSGLLPEDSPILVIPAKLFPKSTGPFFFYIFVCIFCPLCLVFMYTGLIQPIWWFAFEVLILPAWTIIKKLRSALSWLYYNIILNVIKIGEVTIYKRQKLGHGTFGYVFKGKYKDKLRAVKVLRDICFQTESLLLDPQDIKVQEAALKSFNKESLLDLDHPNIVKLVHVCPYPQGNWPCLVMELLDCSLRKYLETLGHPLDEKVQVSLSCDVGKALAYLHERKLIHRDLCGDNVLILKGSIPVAKIADFGMSRIINDPEMMTHSLTVLAHRIGYLPRPPEGHSKEYNLSIDIHMFGAVMIQIVKAVENIDSPEMREDLLLDIAETHPLKKIIQSCVAEKKEDRPTAKICEEQLQNLKLLHAVHVENAKPE